MPRPPRKDFYKLMNRDRIVLRFAVRLVETPGYPLSETDRWALIAAAIERVIQQLDNLAEAYLSVAPEG